MVKKKNAYKRKGSSRSQMKTTEKVDLGKQITPFVFSSFPQHKKTTPRMVFLRMPLAVSLLSASCIFGIDALHGNLISTHRGLRASAHTHEIWEDKFSTSDEWDEMTGPNETNSLQKSVFDSGIDTSALGNRFSKNETKSESDSTSTKTSNSQNNFIGDGTGGTGASSKTESGCDLEGLACKGKVKGSAGAIVSTDDDGGLVAGIEANGEASAGVSAFFSVAGKKKGEKKATESVGLGGKAKASVDGQVRVAGQFAHKNKTSEANVGLSAQAGGTGSVKADLGLGVDSKKGFVGGGGLSFDGKVNASAGGFVAGNHTFEKDEENQMQAKIDGNIQAAGIAEAHASAKLKL